MEPEKRPEALTAEPGDASQRLLGPLDDSGFAQAGGLTPDHGGAVDEPHRRIPPGDKTPPHESRSSAFTGGMT